MAGKKAPGTFELDKETCVCNNVNSRSELNGEEKVPAMDVKLTWDTDNKALAMFHPTLKASFYDANNPKLFRYPNLKSAIDWELKLKGCEMFVALIGKKSEASIDECIVSKFKIEMQEGGKVAITFTVQCHPTESQRGKLTGMVGQEVSVNLKGGEIYVGDDDGRDSDGPLFDKKDGGDGTEKPPKGLH